MDPLRISYGALRWPKDRFVDEKTAQRIGLLTVFFFFNSQTLSVSIRSRSVADTLRSGYVFRRYLFAWKRHG